MKSVSPVKTTFSSPSCMNQQMLSWVWHGVCSAWTEMSPMYSVSPCLGVVVTPWQLAPPMMGRSGWPSPLSCRVVSAILP